MKSYFYHFRRPRQEDYVGNDRFSFARASGIIAPGFMEFRPGWHACPFNPVSLYHEISGASGSPPVCNDSASTYESGYARKTANIAQQKLRVQTVTKLGNHPVGGGGFADVWMGQLEDGTRVAIKVLRVFDPEPEFAVMNEVYFNYSSLVFYLDETDTSLHETDNTEGSENMG